MGSKKHDKSFLSHDRHCTEMSLHPSIVGLDDIVIAAKEINLFKRSGELLGQPDLFAISRDGQMYIAEYKCNNNGYGKAMHQLDRDSSFIKRYMGEMPIKLYVVGDYDVQRVK
jgi:hypothetical protein